MQVNHLLSTWLSGSETESSRTVREKLEQKIDSYAAGELDHARRYNIVHMGNFTQRGRDSESPGLVSGL